jgi:hypothetical protein
VATKRLLVKLSEAPRARAAAATQLGLSGAARFEPILEVPAPARTTFAAGEEASRRHRWYRVEVDARQSLAIAGEENDWDAAHAFLRGQQASKADVRVLAVEPDLEQQWVIGPPPGAPTPAPLALGSRRCDAVPQSERSVPKGPGFAWHLKPEFTGLTDARNEVMANGSDVVIVHLDTGFDPEHASLPEKLDTARQKNFISGENEDDATDHTPPGLLRNPGHGTGTLGILAGGKLKGSLKPPEASTGDYLGGAPLATVVPVRIANSVVRLFTSSVAQGFDYARSIGADVVSMSMGGLPSGAWADAVNAAYEAGIVVVCAAGNNFGGAPVEEIVWPARFKRVIAACGVMADGRPYFDLPPIVMQGNIGPPSKMGTALAAFTPNIPWPKLDCHQTIDLDGGGTSAATPQVAAAAALWLRKYKKDLGYPEPWMRVEAVRRALFEASKPGDAKHPNEFFGEGILNAKAALALAPAAAGSLRQTEKARGPFGFLTSPFGLAADADIRRQELYRLELTQLAVRTRGARAEIADPEADAARITESQRRRFLEAIVDGGKASQALRRYLESELGRASGTPVPAPPRAPARGRARGKAAAPAQPPAPEPYRQARRRPPSRRRLQIFAVDPGMSNKLATSFINRTVVDVRWEASSADPNLLKPGPVGDYLEVVDVDPASGAAYEPVDLNDPFLLAQNGLAPSEGNPQFHQQMAYAVAMNTIDSFETALGRRALWAAKEIQTNWIDPQTGEEKPNYHQLYVPRLRIYPHALRQANAYYSPDKIALLFGYFPELREANGDALGGMVFTCLSHDIVAHETTHALLDGLHRRYQEASNVDVLAFHEAFADIVAIFQHFTFPELLRFEIARTRGDLRSGGTLAELARQFGEALGREKALRSAIGVDPAVVNYATTTEPHDRGSVLVAAVFDAFTRIYQRRIDDLLRIATGGTGVLRPGSIHPDLVDRLADEAAKSARHVLTICIRGLDYCPPVDITFADYLRAVITADADLVGADPYGYRVAFLESFRARGIYPNDVRTLSVESLQWSSPASQPAGLCDVFRQMQFRWSRQGDRREAYDASKLNAVLLHQWLRTNLSDSMAKQLGLDRDVRPKNAPDDGFRLDDDRRPRFEIHSVRPAHRVSPDGQIKSDVIAVITQRRRVPVDPADPDGQKFTFRGGCTLIIDAANEAEPIRYAVRKSVGNPWRLDAQRSYLGEAGGLSLRSLYFGGDGDDGKEPFAFLHIGQ